MGDLPNTVIWIDLLKATSDERAFVERCAGVHVPTRDALNEIEASSRLVNKGGFLYLSTLVVSQSPKTHLESSPVGFVLSSKILVTVRYTALPCFDAVADQIRLNNEIITSVGVFAALLEEVVALGADILESTGGQIDQISQSVFRGDPSNPRHAVRSTMRLRAAISTIGTMAEKVSQARDVLLGAGRIGAFARDVGREWIPSDFQIRLESVSKDITSLNAYEAHLAGKIQFLLDAVLGYITVNQNDIFKVLTIASVAGVPPTLLAGIWGMNFKAMPELDWHWGYPVALGSIALSAAAPLIWFKIRGWF